MSILMTSFLIILLISFVYAQAVSLRRWRGWWRALALLPAIVLVAVVANIIIAVLLDPTSHNLWPLEIVVWSAGGLVYLGVLTVVRRIKHK